MTTIIQEAPFFVIPESGGTKDVVVNYRNDTDFGRTSTVDLNVHEVHDGSVQPDVALDLDTRSIYVGIGDNIVTYAVELASLNELEDGTYAWAALEREQGLAGIGTWQFELSHQQQEPNESQVDIIEGSLTATQNDQDADIIVEYQLRNTPVSGNGVPTDVEVAFQVDGNQVDTATIFVPNNGTTTDSNFINEISFGTHQVCVEILNVTPV